MCPALTSDMEKACPATGPVRKRKDMDAAAPAAGPSDPAAGAGGNRLLAGLLAHEFLSSGTVLGERRGPWSEAGWASRSRYEALAVLVQRGVTRVPGVVNPTQLAAWAGR